MADGEAQRRGFELYVESLEAERDLADELLIAHLRYFGEDVGKVSERLKENPRLVLSLMPHLSSLMQELDSDAGAVGALDREVRTARRMMLLILDASEDGSTPEHGE